MTEAITNYKYRITRSFKRRIPCFNNLRNVSRSTCCSHLATHNNNTQMHVVVLRPSDLVVDARRIQLPSMIWLNKYVDMHTVGSRAKYLIRDIEQNSKCCCGRIMKKVWVSSRFKESSI
ncbi:hypothetical protein WA026_001353 [Henosepilachna vigintioctopunctata]|uniref:Uncharacterized protein n=1 Tax=Henosepilachna vigintioctopunctata TaxID=420089 RepID=A0AAW1UTK5_9CUCU